MHRIRTSLRLLLAAGMFLAITAGPALAQRTYPSFQTPLVVDREFNFAIASGTRVTTALFQWRQANTPRTQLSLDAGFADPDVADATLFLLLGGQLARQLTTSTPDMPLDMLFTAGIFTQLGNDQTRVGIPVGLSLGHRFPIEGTAMAITPYAHPRISLEICGGDPCRGVNRDDRTDMAISFDLGGSLEINRQLGFRLSAKFGGAESLGFSLSWRPGGTR